jgi:hypothetical protein
LQVCYIRQAATAAEDRAIRTDTRTPTLLALAGVLLLAACGGGGGGNPQQNRAPVAALNASQSSPKAPSIVVLNAGGSTDADGTIAEYRWDLGALGQQTTTQPVLRVPVGGDFDGTRAISARVTVVDDDGATDEEIAALFVESGLLETQTLVGTVADVDDRIGMAIVAGNPAIAFNDLAEDRTLYMRALDPAGANWGEPVVMAGNASDYISLAVAGGRLYAVMSLAGILHIGVPAGDPLGTQAWACSLPLEALSVRAGERLQVVEADGRAGLVYRRGGTEDVVFRRADDESALTWNGAPVVLSAAAADLVSGFQYDDRPAAVWLEDENALHFIHATTADGSQWGGSEAIDSGLSDIDTMHAAEIGGSPAVVYDDDDLGLLYAYRIANDDWENRVAVNAGGPLSNLQLLEDGGTPWILGDNAQAGAILAILGDSPEPALFSAPTPLVPGQTNGFAATLIAGRPALAFQLETDLDLGYAH